MPLRVVTFIVKYVMLTVCHVPLIVGMLLMVRHMLHITQ